MVDFEHVDSIKRVTEKMAKKIIIKTLFAYISIILLAIMGTFCATAVFFFLKLDWLSFLGNVLAAIIGGIVTFVCVKISIDDVKYNRIQDRFDEARPYLQLRAIYEDNDFSPNNKDFNFRGKSKIEYASVSV